MRRFATTLILISMPLALVALSGCEELPESKKTEATKKVETEEVEEPCVYPTDWTAQPSGIGDTVPPIVWDNVYYAGNATAPFDFEQFYCDFDQFDTLSVVVTADWCPACPNYIEHVKEQMDEITANRSMIVWFDAQDRSYRPATSENANAYINPKVGVEGPGIRVGAAEVVDGVNPFDNMYSFFPNGFVIRRADMKIIAHDETFEPGWLPFADIAADPDADWNQAVFNSNCAPGDEEPSELNGGNNSAGEAKPITPGTFQGGVCEAAGDYFSHQIAGDWKITLEFTHAVGDLDLAVIQNGEATQFWTDTDNEEATGTGPAVVSVTGWQGASAPYTFTLEEL